MSDAIKQYQIYMDQISSEKIPHYEPTIGDKEKEYVNDVLTNNWFSEGKYTRLFEKGISKFCNVGHALALCNGTAALILGFKALGLGKGDKIIVPTFTHPADVNSIFAIGAEPVFCDIDPKNYSIDPNKLVDCIDDKTKAVLVVHLYGFAVNMKKVMEIAKSKKIYVIEDCAQALGVKYHNQNVGTFGDFGMLSFFADKTITTGEGGILITNNEKIIEEVNIYKHDGRRERGIDIIERAGYNFRITELQTAIGFAQLESLPLFIDKKIKNNKLYKQYLSEIDSVFFPVEDNETYRIPHRVIIEVDDPESLKLFLSKKGIGCRRFYIPMHTQPYIKMKGNFPNSQKAYEKGLCLPSFPMLSEAQIQYVCENIFEYYK